MNAAPTLKIAVLISGGGSTLQNLIDRIGDGRLPAVRIVQVISSRSTVEGNARARRAGLPLQIIRRMDHADLAAFGDAIMRALDACGADLAVLAGWLPLIRVAPHWLGRVINLHPSLLPDFGGKGFHGTHVHEAVLKAGRHESGATVHYVDNEYDHGQIIAQRRCPVMPGDTAAALAARVGEVERELLPDVISSLRRGREKPIEQDRLKRGETPRNG